MLICPIKTLSEFFSFKSFNTLFLLFASTHLYIFRMFLAEIDSLFLAFDKLEDTSSMIVCVCVCVCVCVYVCVCVKLQGVVNKNCLKNIYVCMYLVFRMFLAEIDLCC